MINEQKELVEEIKETSAECIIKNLSEVKDWCSTGCTILDLAIANRCPGGIPLNRIVHIYGASGTCKSVLATTLLGYAQRKGMEAYYADTEYSVDQKFAELLGVDFSKISFGYPGTVEEFFDKWLVSILYKDDKKKKLNTNPKIIVVDSLTALPSVDEKEKGMEEMKHVSKRPMRIGLGFRKYIREVSDSNSTLFFVDQTREDIGSLFGGETTSGGKSREFYPSIRIHLKHYKHVENTSGVSIGEWVRFEIKKNRVAPPFREGKFRLLFDYGIDNIGTNLLFLASTQTKEKKEAEGKTFKIKLFGEEKTRRVWTNYIEENNLEKDLEQEVWKVWQEVYKSEGRKPRIW